MAALAASGAGAFAPNPAGTLLSNGERWGVFNAAEVEFAGDVEQVLTSRCVEVVASGFRWTEGPTWVPQLAALLFSDTVDARIYKWTETGGVTVWLEYSGGFDGVNVEGYDMLFEPGSNGMALEGDSLYICQHPTHRVVKVQLSQIRAGSRFSDNDYVVVADTFRGCRLNSPNDVVVHPGDGSVWFTDPVYGFLLKQAPGAHVPVMPDEPWDRDCLNPADLPYLDERCAAGVGHKGVYRWKDGKLELVTSAHERPNGLAFSPDGKTLWVANSSKDTPSWTAYCLGEELPLTPSVTIGEEQVGRMRGSGVSDGFKIDDRGWIWSSMPSGICVIDPDPRAPRVVAKVIFGTNISNIQFGAGGDVWVTGLGHLWRLQRRVA